MAWLQLLHRVVAAGDGGRGPGAGGEHDERVEHVGVEPGGVDQRVVAAFDRGAQPAAQRRVQRALVLEVGDAERDVPGLVDPGQAGDLAR